MADLSGLRALIVEDEAAVAFLLEAMLQDLGVAVAASVARVGPALAVAADIDADFAVLDINLAGETSLLVAERLAQRGVPFLFVTGYGSHGVPEALQDRPVVTKPFVAAQLRQAIEQALGR